jgi:hypothetical protein
MCNPCGKPFYDKSTYDRHFRHAIEHSSMYAHCVVIFARIVLIPITDESLALIAIRLLGKRILSSPIIAYISEFPGSHLDLPCDTHALRRQLPRVPLQLL